MRKIEPNDNYSKFPQKEKAYALIPQKNAPFEHAVVGITYPHADYHIDRPATAGINVLEFVIDGEGELLLDGVWKKVTAGSLYILRAGEAHHYRAVPSRPFHKMWINYSARYLPAFLDAYGIRSGIFPETDAKKYFDLAIETVKHPASHAEACRTVSDCVHRLISLAAMSNGAEEESDAHRIREELDLSIYKKTDLDTVCDSLHVSKSNAIRLFKKHYGITPYEYLLHAKIEAAKALLVNTRLPIKDIAQKLHVMDEHYFSTLFLRRVGIRPGDYRKRETRPEQSVEK